MPIGAGPYKVTDNTATVITTAKNENYTGAYKGHVDKVTFKIYNDASPAYNDTVANNLDINDLIPTDQNIFGLQDVSAEEEAANMPVEEMSPEDIEAAIEAELGGRSRR